MADQVRRYTLYASINTTSCAQTKYTQTDTPGGTVLCVQHETSLMSDRSLPVTAALFVGIGSESGTFTLLPPQDLLPCEIFRLPACLRPLQ